MRYEETILIDAPLDLIWRLTVHIEDWPDFLPTVQRLDRLDTGDLHVGSAARIKQPHQAPAVWTVTRLEPGREFTWHTRRPGVTLIGTHLLREAGAGTRMTLCLEATGPGARLASVLFGGMMRSAVRQEAAAFARYATPLR